MSIRNHGRSNGLLEPRIEQNWLALIGGSLGLVGIHSKHLQGEAFIRNSHYPQWIGLVSLIGLVSSVLGVMARKGHHPFPLWRHTHKSKQQWVVPRKDSVPSATRQIHSKRDTLQTSPHETRQNYERFKGHGTFRVRPPCSPQTTNRTTEPHMGLSVLRGNIYHSFHFRSRLTGPKKQHKLLLWH